MGEGEFTLIWTENTLQDLLTTPSDALVEDIGRIQGDIGILGAGGKMGPTLALLARRACQKAGMEKKIWAISRFTNKAVEAELKARGVHTLSVDLMQKGAMAALPELENILYMAGRKFGTDGNEAETWAMNVSLPTLVARRFQGSGIVVFSSGNIYPQADLASGGSTDDEKPVPIGEYAMSTLGRERVFEAAARTYGSRVLLFRLNYSVDLRYGVLSDLAKKVLSGEPIDVTTGNFNCVWQGYANEAALRALLHVQNPAEVLNVTGPETVSVRYAATELARHFGKPVRFAGQEARSAYLNNAAKCFDWFGYPQVPLRRLIRWQAEWMLSGGNLLNAPTHFEERNGSY